MGKRIDSTHVLVCQRGARHRYAIPRLLEEAGLLAALYTDSSVHSPAGKLAQGLGKIGLTGKRRQALAKRVPTGVPSHKIFSSDCLLHASFSNGILPGDLPAIYTKWGLRGANVVYSMCGEDFDFLEWAKGQGAKIVIDVFVHPGTARIVAEETLAATGEQDRSEHSVEDEENHFLRSFQLADIILCPSGWVAAGVREYAPEREEKIRVVPYGSSLQLKESINENPDIGRILFAGREPLRKGLHHLAAAARLIRQKGVSIDVCVAGIDAADTTWMQHREELNYLGTLPMDRMHAEFRRADVFVLPSLSEGQAGVLLEAMASGCPVVATAQSGVDFEPDCGVTIPVCDPKALSEALLRIISDRAHRNTLAKGGLRQAKAFSMEAWKRRLAEAVLEASAL